MPSPRFNKQLYALKRELIRNRDMHWVLELTKAGVLPPLTNAEEKTPAQVARIVAHVVDAARITEPELELIDAEDDTDN